MNEIRNELLTILSLIKNGEKDKEYNINYLLERFEYDIKGQLDETKRKEKELQENLQTLEFVKKELSKTKEER